jgi:hypothetical protein
MKLRHGLLALLFASLSVAPASAQAVIKWKFKQGDKFYLDNASDIKQSFEIMGMTQKQDLANKMLVSYEVVKAEGGSTVLQEKIEKASMEIKSGVPPAVANQMTALSKQMTGATFKITLNPEGKITNFEGFDAFVKKITQANPQAAQMLPGLLSKETMSKGVEEAFGFTPAKPVNPGDKWTRNATLPMGPLGDAKVDTTYTYKGKAGKDEEIDIEAAMTFSPPKTPTPGAAVSKVNMKTESAKGKILFDAQSGRMVKQEMKIHLKGSMTVNAAGNEVSMDMDQDQTHTVRVLDKPPAD